MSIQVNVNAEDVDQEATGPLIRVEQPQTVVIFGGTGDLTRRKLLPALLRRDGVDRFLKP